MIYALVLLLYFLILPLVARVVSLFVPLTFSYEDRHTNESWLQWKLGNLLTVPKIWIRSFAFVWGFKENGEWVFLPRLVGIDSLYYNGILFLRLSLPFDIRIGIRWSGRTDKAALWQGGFGFKASNGRFAPTFRVQSDDSAAKGTNSPNYFNGRGWNFGSH